MPIVPQRESSAGQLSDRFRRLDGALIEFGVAGEHPSGLPAGTLALFLTGGTTRDGHTHAPARDFMAVAADECALAVERGLRLAAAAALTGRDPRRPLAAARDAAHEAVVRAIDTWTTPGNAESTIKRKGRDDPLVDTGALRDLSFAGYALGALAREVTR